MPRNFSEDPKIDKALRHSVRDGVSYSVMTGAGETYFAAFALFFKATTAQIGLLASLPSLIATLAQLFAVWLSRQACSRKKIIIVGASLQALVWLPLIVLPVLFPDYAVVIIIFCIIGYHAAGSVIIPYWSSLMGDLVPENRRGRYFALRNRYTSISALISLIVAGIVLDYYQQHALAIYGFIGVFTIAALARWKSIYHLTHLIDPGDANLSLDMELGGDWWQQLRQSQLF